MTTKVRLTDREREALASIQPGHVLYRPYNRRVLNNLVRKRVLSRIWCGAGYVCGPLWEEARRVIISELCEDTDRGLWDDGCGPEEIQR